MKVIVAALMIVFFALLVMCIERQGKVIDQFRELGQAHALIEKYRKEQQGDHFQSYVSKLRQEGWTLKDTEESHIQVEAVIAQLEHDGYTVDITSFYKDHPKYGRELLYVITVADYHTDDADSEPDAIPKKVSTRNNSGNIHTGDEADEPADATQPPATELRPRSILGRDDYDDYVPGYPGDNLALRLRRN